jgi:hypothetical protein
MMPARYPLAAVARQAAFRSSGHLAWHPETGPL